MVGSSKATSALEADARVVVEMFAKNDDEICYLSSFIIKKHAVEVSLRSFQSLLGAML